MPVLPAGGVPPLTSPWEGAIKEAGATGAASAGGWRELIKLKALNGLLCLAVRPLAEQGLTVPEAYSFQKALL